MWVVLKGTAYYTLHITHSRERYNAQCSRKGLISDTALVSGVPCLPLTITQPLAYFTCHSAIKPAGGKLAKYASSRSSVLLPDERESWWLKMTPFPPGQGDEEPLSMYPSISIYLIPFGGLVLRWTLRARRASSWRSATSWLTSFSRGGRSLGARSRRGRWGDSYTSHTLLCFLVAPF